SAEAVGTPPMRSCHLLMFGTPSSPRSPLLSNLSPNCEALAHPQQALRGQLVQPLVLTALGALSHAVDVQVLQRLHVLAGVAAHQPFQVRISRPDLRDQAADLGVRVEAADLL